MEAVHRGRGYNTEALARSVEETWQNGELEEVIRKVNNRLLQVLGLIVDGGGSNRLVEENRGKNFEDLDGQAENDTDVDERLVRNNTLYSFVDEEPEIQMHLLNSILGMEEAGV